jgi:hypothetical protein
LDYIYKKETLAFKINMTFGFILKNVEDGKLRFFKPYINQNILETPFTISNKKHLEKLKELIKSLDLIHQINKTRENTKYKVLFITNVLFTLFPFDYNLGGEENLPNFILQNNSIKTFFKEKSGKKFDDDLCFFRCLVYHNLPSLSPASFRKEVSSSLKKWLDYKQEIGEPIKIFSGVKLTEIPQLELCFSININIFELNSLSCCSPVHKSVSKFSNTLNLNKYQNHLSLILNVNSYCRKFICPHCNKHFPRKDNYQRHEKNCTNKLKLSFVGGFYSSYQTLFEEMNNFDIRAPSPHFFEEFIVYDLEAMLSPNYFAATEKLTWTQDHIPISVSICSNVEGFTKPYCIVDGDREVLVREMVEYMKKIADKIKKRNIDKFEGIFEQIDELISEHQRELISEQNKKNSLHKSIISYLEKLQKKLEKYCFEVPVLGFNSARYDINLIKSSILKQLEVDKDADHFVVKKNNSYTCISNGSFKFLDISQFLSPGTSYSNFLKSFDVKEEKGFFPYEYLSSIEKLEETSLPPITAFWSSLKNKNVLDDGVNSIQENYSKLQNVWREEDMKTFKDFLIWYNNLDVGPFVTAVKRLCQFYFDKGVDLFKETISVPGVARKLLFREARKQKAVFSLPNKDNEDLFHCINDNIVGGPSIVFNRFHKKDETFIRNDLKIPCKKIIGFDANALYLWSFDQKMPVGSFIRRKSSNNFRPQKNEKYSNMYYWMDWLSKSSSLDIKHFKNQGKERRIGTFLVDGFDSKSNTIFHYHGCYFHGHTCLEKKVKKKKEIKKMKERRERTYSTKLFLEQKGYTVKEIYECEFEELKLKERSLRQFIWSNLSTFTQLNPGKVTENQILEGVRSGDLFGMVEVDISVPQSWEEVTSPPDTNLSPKEYFQEMSPFFGNVDIPFEMIGEHMQDHIKKHNLSQKPRRLLIGGMKAEQILLATPLLQWYLEHGLKVSKIYQTVEYSNPSCCFSSFVQEVSNSRRMGDQNPSKSSLAETMKLIGNSAFGSMIMNKMRHKNIYYVRDYKDISKAVNSSSFYSLKEISEEFFEIEAFKKSIRLDLPTQIGFFILQLGKLRMLQFYYDFMDKFVHRKFFEYCEMDTDSAYMALASDNLEEIIKEEMKEKYHHGLVGFCSDNHPSADDEFHWFPRKCCSHHSIYDKRTPGLFKVEFEGDEIISLCSKTYFVGGGGGQFKFSSKGINKSKVENPKKVFRDVLFLRKSGEGINAGFRVQNNTMKTYHQQKDAFSYVYCKRKLDSDGVSTLPLDITIQPRKKMKSSIYS